MNSCHFLVKIVSQPRQRKISDDIFVVENKVKFLKIRKGKKKVLNSFKLFFGVTLARNFQKRIN